MRGQNPYYRLAPRPAPWLNKPRKRLVLESGLRIIILTNYLLVGKVTASLGSLKRQELVRLPFELSLDERLAIMGIFNRCGKALENHGALFWLVRSDTSPPGLQSDDSGSKPQF